MDELKFNKKNQIIHIQCILKNIYYFDFGIKHSIIC